MPEWLKGADCKSTAFATLVRIQIGPKINHINIYIAAMFLIIKKTLKVALIIKKVKRKRNLNVFKRLFNGVNKTNIKPVKLLIKKRGYLKIFSQKLFIYIYNFN